MKLRVFLISWVSVGSLWILLATSVLAQATTVVIRDVTVVDVTDGSLQPEQTVLVKGNRIGAVGAAANVDVPAAAEIVEGAGGYLIPGLWDMHVHAVDPAAEGTAEPSITTQDWYFPLFLAHGVTGVRNMNDRTGDVTLELTNSVRRRLAEGDLPGPARFLSAGPSIDGDPPLGTNSVVVRTAAEAREVVDALADAGADFVKPYENLSREAYFAMVDQARRRGLPVDGHIPFRITPEEAAEAGQRTVEHPVALAQGCAIDSEIEAERVRFARVLADFGSLAESEKVRARWRHPRAVYDLWNPAACASAFQAFRRHGVAVVVDLIVFHHIVHAEEILSDPAHVRLIPESLRPDPDEASDSPDPAFRELQSILGPIPALELEAVRLANEAGVELLAASDAGLPVPLPGISLHEELARLVGAGLTPLEALQAATLNPVRVLAMADSLGTVKEGKLADLVLLDANPLEDITNTRLIRAVVADGRLYRRADLDRLLAHAQRPPPIIDMHLHASADDWYADGPVPICRPAVMGIRPDLCPDTLWSSTLDDPVMEATLAVVERRNIFGVLAGPVEVVREWVAAAPERFIPAADPQSDGIPNPTSSPEALRPLFESGEFSVLAEMDPQFAGVPPNDSTLEPYWAMAEALDIPVGIHMGEGPPGSGRMPQFSDYRARLTNPLLLEEVLARHPDLRVFVMHYGSPMIDEMIAMMYTYPQLYVDIGGHQWFYPREYFYRQLRKLVEAGFGDRIMFGSDQMIWPQVIEPAIEIIEQAPFLSEEQKRDILYNNAARFLRLSEEEIARHHGR